MVVKIKRIYERPDVTDGLRILADRLWPRGVRRSTANVDIWLKDVGPTDELRKWFAHDPKKFMSFKKKYLKELTKNPAFEDIVNIALTNDTITLLFSASDEKHNNAVVLQGAIEKAVKKAIKRHMPVPNKPIPTRNF